MLTQRKRRQKNRLICIQLRLLRTRFEIKDTWIENDFDLFFFFGGGGGVKRWDGKLCVPTEKSWLRPWSGHMVWLVSPPPRITLLSRPSGLLYSWYCYCWPQGAYLIYFDSWFIRLAVLTLITLLNYSILPGMFCHLPAFLGSTMDKKEWGIHGYLSPQK